MSDITPEFLETMRERIAHHTIKPVQLGRAMGGSDKLACQRGHLLINYPPPVMKLSTALAVCDGVGLDIVAKRQGKPSGEHGKIVEEIKAQLDEDERTVAWFGRLLGKHRQQIHQWLSGQDIRLSSLSTMCDALDIEITVRPRKGWTLPEAGK